MPVAQIVAVERFDHEQIAAASIDLPTPGSVSHVHSLDIHGWVLGAAVPVVAMDVMMDESRLCRVPLEVRRPDVHQVYPGIDGSPRCGFKIHLCLLGLPREFSPTLNAVFRDQSVVELGRLRIRRTRIVSGAPAPRQPLMLSSMGRSGSTWVCHLLGQHPDIVAYRPFQAEARVGAYWMNVLETIANPTSYLHAIATELSSDYWWTGHRQPPRVLPAEDGDIAGFMGRETTEDALAFCQRRIDGFYDLAARQDRKPDARFFVEKSPAKDVTQDMLLEIYPEGREVFLVRDLRDMFVSILEYNIKLDYAGFGRSHADSEEAFAWRLRGFALQLLRRWKRRRQQAWLLRFEDVVLDPEPTLRALLAHLGLDDRAVTVARMVEGAQRDKASAQRAHRTSSGPEDSIGRWRHATDWAHQSLLKEVFAGVLEEFGYEDES